MATGPVSSGALPVKGYSLFGLLSLGSVSGESNAGALNRHIPFLAYAKGLGVYRSFHNKVSGPCL